MNQFPRRISVTDSWAIEEIAYNKHLQQLRVHFSSTDTTWMYYDVPEEVFTELVLADSIGEHFNLKIRDTYKAERVR